MTPAQWNAEPWWYTRVLMEGLTKEGILGDPNNPDSPPAQPAQQGSDKSIDMSMGGPIPVGFQTRRVG